MNDQEMRIAIAEACGWDAWVIVKNGAYYLPNACGYTYSISEAWKLPKAKAKKYEMYADRTDVPACERVLIEPAPIPDYATDLNAIHQACMENLTGHQGMEFFWVLLRVMNQPENLAMSNAAQIAVHATARQRSEAFLRTIGKWKE